MTRRLAALGLVLLLTALAVQLAACGAATDPFAGKWWDPTSGRRVEIRAADGGYEVLFGTDLTPRTATRSGDELRVTQPDVVVIRRVAEGRLVLVSGGTESRLERVPQHD